jgi:hypothetical protein
MIVQDSTNDIRIPVGVDGQVVIADSSTSSGIKWGNLSGGGGTSFPYRFETATSVPPGTGRVRYDAAGQTTATQMHVNATTNQGDDIHNLLLNFVAIGDRLTIINDSSSSQYQTWRVDSIVDNTTYITYGITFITSQGSNFTNLQTIGFGISGASSGSVTMQNTYDNSGAPQILTSDTVLEIQRGDSLPTFTIHGDGNSETGRTQYDFLENFAASGGALEGNAFITTSGWRFEEGTVDEVMRIGHDGTAAASSELNLGSLSTTTLIDIVRLRAKTILVDGPEGDNNGEFDLLRNGPGGPRAFRYLTETTTTPSPGDNAIRWNNATQSSATKIFVDNDALNLGSVLGLLGNVDDTATLYLTNEARTKFQQFTLSAVTAQSTYIEYDVTNDKSFGGNMSAEEVMQVIFQEGASGGGTTTFPSFQIYADQFDSPTNVDWAVNSVAPSSSDTNNNGLNVRRFRDSTDDGVGFTIRIPSGATDVIFTFQSRAEATPGGTVAVALNIYEREIPDNAAPTAWSSAIQLTDISLPANEFFQTDSQTISLAALGLAVDQTHQLELVRDTADINDTLVDDWSLLLLGVDFA